MEDKPKRISYRQKNPTICPVCSNEFHREDLLSGGGRLIAGKLTDELRRLYEVSKKYGQIYPPAYAVTVCPSCLYSAFPKDFENPEPKEVEQLSRFTSARKTALKKFFGSISFEEDRTLETGAASYMLAIDCYNFRNKNVAPTFKSALCAIRTAWLFSDLAEKYPERPYSKISNFFYNKAYKLYIKLLDLVQSGDEPSEAANNMGPDTDKNWGYEGILYLAAVLTVKYGSKEPDYEKRVRNFQISKKYLSRIFGLGKSSKEKPTEILEKTREYYEIIRDKLKEWEQEAPNENEE